MRAFRSRSRQVMSALLTSVPESSWLPVASLPTLSATSYGSSNNGTRDGEREFYLKGKPSLETMAKRGMLPTLTVDGNYNRKGASEKSGDGLTTAISARYPTLCSRDEKGPGPAHTQGGKDLPATLGGHLSPEWCLWFMGFPAGYLDVDDAPAFERSATRSFRSALKLSARSSKSSSNKSLLPKKNSPP